MGYENVTFANMSCNLNVRFMDNKMFLETKLLHFFLSSLNFPVLKIYLNVERVSN